VVLWATTQIEQEALSVLLGWLWVDSATAVHNIRDRQSQVNHREVSRIRSRIGLDSLPIITVALPYTTPGKLLWEGNVVFARFAVAGRAPFNSQAREYMSEPSYEELKARLSQLEKEVEIKKRSGDLIFKVGEKGGVSVYGLGRFPVTLYYEQWNRLLGAADDIKKFLEENKSRLKLKEQG